MSANVTIAFDVRASTALMQGGASDWAKVANAFARRRSPARGDDPAEVREYLLTDLGFTDIEGPWDFVVIQTGSLIVIGFGEKWSVFLADAFTRDELLSSARDFLSVIGSVEGICFPNDDYGRAPYEAALGCDTYSALIDALDSVAQRVDLEMASEASLVDIGERIAGFEWVDDPIYFVMRVA